MIQEAQQRKQQEDARMKSTLENINKIGDFDVNKKSKDRFSDMVSNGKFMEKMFYTDGKLDYGKMFNVYMKATGFDNMMKVNSTKTKNDTTREIVKDLSNPQIKGRTSSSTVSDSNKNALHGWLNELRGSK